MIVLKWTRAFAVILMAGHLTSAFAATVLDDFNGQAESLAFDSSNNIYAVGNNYVGWKWTVRKSTDGGATWAEVDTINDSNSEARVIRISPTGEIYVIGHSSDENRQLNWTVRKSSNSGATWTTVDKVPGLGQSLVINPSSPQELYACGYKYIPAGKVEVYVRKSSDGGANWITVDSVPGTRVYCTDMLVDNQNNPYWVGTLENQWIVRKATNSGYVWNQIDHFSANPDEYEYAFALGIASDSQGTLFVSGRSGSDNSSWYVRKSTDHGVTWSILDEYRYMNSEFTGAGKLVVGPQDELFVLGASKYNGNTHAIIRKSVDHGITWTVIEDFVYLHSFVMGAFVTQGAALDSSGNFYWTMGAFTTATGSRDEQLQYHGLVIKK